MCKRCVGYTVSTYFGGGGTNYVRGYVRIRDNFTCQSCKKQRTPEQAKREGKRLFDVHHINGLCGKGRNYRCDRVSEMNLLITLCHKCHFSRHDWGGKKKPPENFQRGVLYMRSQF